MEEIRDSETLPELERWSTDPAKKARDAALREPEILEYFYRCYEIL